MPRGENAAKGKQGFQRTSRGMNPPTAMSRNTHSSASGGWLTRAISCLFGGGRQTARTAAIEDARVAARLANTKPSGPAAVRPSRPKPPGPGWSQAVASPAAVTDGAVAGNDPSRPRPGGPTRRPPVRDGWVRDVHRNTIDRNFGYVPGVGDVRAEIIAINSPTPASPTRWSTLTHIELDGDHATERGAVHETEEAAQQSVELYLAMRIWEYEEAQRQAELAHPPIGQPPSFVDLQQR